MKKKILIACSYTLTDLPELSLPEIAFCGRSNCGKSSLINKIFNIKNLAHTSSKPGKTKSINFFNYKDIKTIVDLPGYGFAKVSLSELKTWKETISNYINTRTQLQAIVLLIDIRRGFQEEEISFIGELIQEKNIIISIVFTKNDKFTNSELAISKRQLLEYIAKTWQSINEIFFISCLKNTGIIKFKEFIESL